MMIEVREDRLRIRRDEDFFMIFNLPYFIPCTQRDLKKVAALAYITYDTHMPVDILKMIYNWIEDRGAAAYDDCLKQIQELYSGAGAFDAWYKANVRRLERNKKALPSFKEKLETLIEKYE